MEYIYILIGFLVSMIFNAFYKKYKIRQLDKKIEELKADIDLMRSINKLMKNLNDNKK